MPTNMQQLYPQRLPNKKIAHGITMPFSSLMIRRTRANDAWGGFCINADFTDFVGMAQGISVPCSRGGPPLLFE